MLGYRVMARVRHHGTVLGCWFSELENNPKCKTQPLKPILHQLRRQFQVYDLTSWSSNRSIY